MKRPRITTLVGLGLIAGAFLVLVGIGLSGALVYYVTPTELAAGRSTDNVRVYGIVEPRSVRWDAPSSTLTFRITDGETTLTVVSRSLPTGLFHDGIGVVLAGRATGNGEFTADEVLVKHSEVYEPLRPGETPPPGLLESIRQEAP